MSERFNKLPKDASEQFPVRMSQAEFILISGDKFESDESKITLQKLGITIDDGVGEKWVKISVNGDIKYMCINRGDFGTLWQTSR